MTKKLSVFAFCGLILTAPVAHAQYDAGATPMLGQGMGFSALSSSTYRNSIEAAKGKNGSRDTKAQQKQTDKRSDTQKKRAGSSTTWRRGRGGRGRQRASRDRAGPGVAAGMCQVGRAWPAFPKEMRG